AEDRFAKRHAGTLEVNEAWLPSFYGPQRIEGLSLRDPDGSEVLHADVVAPRFGELDANGTFGPIEIHLDRLALAEDATGATNLGRALALRDPAQEASFRVQRTRRGFHVQFEGFGFDLGTHALGLSLAVDRLSFTEAGGQGLLLFDLTASGEV